MSSLIGTETLPIIVDVIILQHFSVKLLTHIFGNKKILEIKNIELIRYFLKEVLYILWKKRSNIFILSLIN